MVPVLGAAATAGKLGPKAAKLAGKVTSKMDEAAAGAKQFFGENIKVASKLRGQPS